ncbi:cobalamin biosynthesis protein CobQ [Cellulomonas sp. Y8]|uniref:MinD/ParA family ATP-binding protein n=1 Tax=Cellulomonas sp. Y8 TaxID=2591145 RepID=UPI0011C72F8F|nr:cobalamin biosynthesis protein CobQ [Cellulomonas sp. Y8]
MNLIWPGSAYEADDDEVTAKVAAAAQTAAPPPAPAEPAEQPSPAGKEAGPRGGPQPTSAGTLLASKTPGDPTASTAQSEGPPAAAAPAAPPAQADVATPVRGVPVAPVPAWDHVLAGDPPRTSVSADLLASPDPDAAAAAAPLTGWRRAVRIASLGIVRPRPSREARELVADTAAVGVQLAGARTVIVANPKGGGGKTPTVVGLSATYGCVRGGRVLAWDNNETTGTLGVRTFPQRYATTAVDLLRALGHLEGAGVRAGDLAAFVRHQASGHFDVLVSDEDPARMSQIDAAAFARLHDLLTGVYEVLVVDTGNNARSPNFLAAVDVADALVIPLSLKPDSVLSAGRLIDQLRAYGRDDLVEHAVTVISDSGESGQAPADIARWSAFFEETTAAVVHVPFDPHLNVGGPITFDQLAPATRRAYLRAGARVAQVLSARPGQRPGWSTFPLKETNR